MLSTTSPLGFVLIVAALAAGANADLSTLKGALSELSSDLASKVVPDKNSPTSNPTNGKCAIIFDFDGVIKIYQDNFDNDSSIGANANQVYRTARERNLAIGLATMSCEKDFIMRYLNGNFDSASFTDGWLQSERAQFCEPKKSVQMAKIIGALGADWNCAILYDDSPGNEEDVVNAGHIYQPVDRYVGITMSDFENGLSRLRQSGDCNC